MSKIENMRKLVALHKEGLTDDDIAHVMRVSLEWVQETRNFMELPERFPVTHSGQQDEISVQPKSVGPRSQKEKKRKCLKCQNMFLSEHIGNRICFNCTKTSAFGLGAEWVGAVI